MYTALKAPYRKTGPSAGIAMVTAITSALTGIPVRHDVAMTGEVTLRGRVLPIGGLREKSMAAYRSGIHTVFVPRRQCSRPERGGCGGAGSRDVCAGFLMSMRCCPRP